MATCPECGAAVPEGAAVCPACGEMLGAVGEAEVEGRECPNCGNTVPANAEACPACGHLHASTVACATHPERQATGACVVCDRPLCDECDRGEGPEYLCEQHSVVPVTEGWAQVYTTGDDVEADLVRDNLLAEGIDAQVLSQKDHFSFTMDIGDLAQVRVLVPAFEYEDAMRVLSTHTDSMRDVAMVCPACGAAYEAGDASCGACGASLVEG
ncbi:MAG TPA: zinc-ribbon domain-containing protein [Longimicrobiales bacterium]